MKTKLYFQYILLTIILFSFENGYGQLSFGGKPVDEVLYPLNEVKFIRMPEFDMSMKVKSARESSIRLKSLEFAHPFSVQMNPFNSGEWRMLPDGRKLWKLGIHSKEAYSLNLIFDQFSLAEGVSMFIYTPDRSKIIGSFNHNNNSKHGLAFEPLPGETVIIELLVPLTVQDFGELSITSVNHDYLGIFGSKATMNGNSGKCNVDINCPEGNNYQLEKSSVMRLLISGSFVCTGALVNNTSQDGRPYVLTANHCLYTQSAATNTVFLFGYEATSCNGTGSSNKSISGSTLRATKESLDMTLLELSSTPDISYRPYYLGWNRQTTPATTTYGIHHPRGDWKKICKATDPPVSVTVQGYSSQSHWRIKEWVLGTTEPGSSGSPLLDVNSRIIGYLSGGDAVCGNPVNDYYGKFSSSWDLFTSSNEQLKFWLDPDNTGALTMDGFNPHQHQTLSADFEINTTYVCQDEVFVFTDFSSGNITSYSWNFGTGATPAAATGKGPHFVSYSSSGQKTATLQVGDGTNLNQTQKEFNLFIKNTDLPVAEFSYVINLRQVNFTNESINGTSYYWEFGDGTASTATDTVKNYSADGDFPVMLWVRNGPCNDKEIKTLLKVSSPIVVEEEVNLRIYPNPASNMVFVEFDEILQAVNIEIFSITGVKLISEKISSSPNQIQVDHLPNGVYILKVFFQNSIYTGKLLINR